VQSDTPSPIAPRTDARVFLPIMIEHKTRKKPGSTPSHARVLQLAADVDYYPHRYEKTQSGTILAHQLKVHQRWQSYIHAPRIRIMLKFYRAQEHATHTMMKETTICHRVEGIRMGSRAHWSHNGGLSRSHNSIEVMENLDEITPHDAVRLMQVRVSAVFGTKDAKRAILCNH